MLDWLFKVFGIKSIQDYHKNLKEIEHQLQKAKEDLIDLKEETKRQEEWAKLSEKERHTLKKEPWISVLETHIDPTNLKNGFFELDWNIYFIEELKKYGYGVDNDPEEEIVNRWFKDIVYQVIQEEQLDMNRSAGYINVQPIQDGKSEVS